LEHHFNSMADNFCYCWISGSIRASNQLKTFF